MGSNSSKAKCRCNTRSLFSNSMDRRPSSKRSSPGELGATNSFRDSMRNSKFCTKTCHMREST